MRQGAAPSGAFLLLTIFIRLHWCLLLLSSALLLGCASANTPVSDAISALVAKATADAPALGARLNPAYRYLRVDAQGQAPALLVLGYIDPHPLAPIEVWYSGSGEVLKLQNGRIIATAGLAPDWRSVRFVTAPPQWSAVPAQGDSYQRVRDEMPAHRYGIAERVAVTPVPAGPPTSVSVTLPLAQARAATWFREDTHGNPGEDALPSAWFAWARYQGQPDVVYSQQCLSPNFCLQLLRWPLEGSAP